MTGFLIIFAKELCAGAACSMVMLSATVTVVGVDMLSDIQLCIFIKATVELHSACIKPENRKDALLSSKPMLTLM